jgi:hypothetical protein
VSPEQVVRAALWALTSTATIIASFIYAQVEGTDITTIVLGGAGLVGLVGLVWRLVSDYHQTSELIDDYAAALKDERAENHILREQIRQNRQDPTP